MYKIYWTDLENQSHGIYTNNLACALRIAKEKRRAGFSFVSLTSENPDSVGQPGVDSIKDGVLPDGENYTWMKRRTQ